MDALPPAALPTARLPPDLQAGLIGGFSLDGVLRSLNGNMQKNSEDAAAAHIYLTVGLLHYCQNEVSGG